MSTALVLDVQMMASAKRIMAEEGAIGFFKGFAPCFARAAPANSVTFLMYGAFLPRCTPQLPVSRFHSVQCTLQKLP